jgi:predicted transglutaminase-like cysteine proteinase
MQKDSLRRRNPQRFRLRPVWRTVLAAGFVLAASMSQAARAEDMPEDEAEFPPLATSVPASGLNARPTRAWEEFCTRSPAECAVDPSEPRRIALDHDVWNTIVDINDQVNLEIQPVPDNVHWGVEDRWDYPDDGMGDCEDIQLLKRRRLVQAGLPKRALRMAVVLDRAGAGHAVLLTYTDHGDFVLDNAVGAILPWEETGYQFIKREGQDDDRIWIAFGVPQPAPAVTAQR